MSLGYYITIRECITTPVTIEAEDKLEQRINLRSILPIAEMKELFKQALQEIGFIEMSDASSRLHRLDPSGEEQILDLETLTLTAQLQRTSVEIRTLKGQTEISKREGEREAEARQLLQDRLLEDVNALTVGQSRELQLKLSKQLADHIPERNEMIHTALQKTYAEALKQKARELGQVLEQSETCTEEGQYELHIKIEI